MKKVLALLLALCLVFAFCSCGKKNDNTIEVFKDTGIEIDTSAFPEKTVLKVEAVEESCDKFTTAKKALPKAVELFAYEITAESKGVVVQPDGSVTVNFPLPETFDNTKHDVAIYYVADDGTTELITSSVADGKIVAALNHFSTYVVVLLEKETTTETESSKVSQSVSSEETQSKKPTSSKEQVSSKPTSSSSSPTPSSSKPADTKPTSSATSSVTVPKLSEATVEKMVKGFISAGRWAYGSHSDEGPFYNKADFKNMDPITIEDFLFSYSFDSFQPYEKEDDGFYVYTVPYDFMSKLSKKVFGIDFNFKKSTSLEEVISYTYNASDDTITIRVSGGGMGDPDGFIYRSFSQSNDTITVSVIYRSLEDEKPAGKENVDWILDNLYGEDCYFTLSKPSTITLKYVDGNWVFKSFLPK